MNTNKRVQRAWRPAVYVYTQYIWGVGAVGRRVQCARVPWVRDENGVPRKQSGQLTAAEIRVLLSLSLAWVRNVYIDIRYAATYVAL